MWLVTLKKKTEWSDLLALIWLQPQSVKVILMSVFSLSLA